VLPPTVSAGIPTERQPPPAAPQRPPVRPAQPAQPPPPVAGGPACPNCGRVNKAGARFCALCGAALAAAQAAARLKITSPRGAWEQRLDSAPLRIGRRDPRQHHYPELDLADHDKGIASRNHAVISRSGDAYQLTDVGSTNGTLLNGQLVPQNQPQRLRTGDRIKIGEVEIEFRWG
jgi:hypothetical protein